MAIVGRYYCSLCDKLKTEADVRHIRPLLGKEKISCRKCHMEVYIVADTDDDQYDEPNLIYPPKEDRSRR